MITVSVTKKPGLTASFIRTFEDASEAAKFADSWLPMHVCVTENDLTMDAAEFIIRLRTKGSAFRPFQDADGSDETCPFCDAPETPILADDELLHACGVCDRCWYVDEEQNVLPADRCPACEPPVRCNNLGDGLAFVFRCASQAPPVNKPFGDDSIVFLATFRTTKIAEVAVSPFEGDHCLAGGFVMAIRRGFCRLGLDHDRDSKSQPGRLPGFSSF